MWYFLAFLSATSIDAEDTHNENRKENPKLILIINSLDVTRTKIE